ncbi:beta-propeller domain-containing protein [Erythrobacter sp. 3-20A1M]|uniref:beta-propeller domain-containing protein n=1 Tax=Erythrobacter sp. 3-20A1M TaxID=2653850 RepID=UPI0035303ED7
MDDIESLASFSDDQSRRDKGAEMGWKLRLGLLGLAALTAGCATSESVDQNARSAMPAVRGERQLSRYFAQAEKDYDRYPPMPMALPAPLAVEQGPVLSDAGSAPSADTSQLVVVTGTRVEEPGITNTQEVGVDEGGIVKRHGDHLIVLRRGRLFSVAIGEGGLASVDAIDAFAPGDDDPGDTWYDEMLIEGDQVVVIGYSYGDDGTEINRFTISPEGRFAYRDTHYLTSGDYYSSRNYASRLIGDELLFYAPVQIDFEDWRAALPTVRAREADGTIKEARRNSGATTLFVPGAVLAKPNGQLDTFHTVTSCSLSGPDLPCRSTVVLGAWGRDFYFSSTAAYVWTDGINRLNQQTFDEEPFIPPMLYRIPLDGSAPRAIGVAGSPVDQFSFREDGGSAIDILTRAEDGGGGMWGGEVSDGTPMLLHLSLDRLGDGSDDARRGDYRELPPVDGYRFFNRYVGRHLLYASGSYGREENTPEIYIVPLDHQWVTTIKLPHGVTRFDALGDDAVAIGPDAAGGLGFSSIALDRANGSARLVNTYAMARAEEAETRSQALFYRSDPGSPDGANGMLGLPVSLQLRDDLGEFLGDASAIAFLRRDDRKLSPAGQLDSRPVANADGRESDQCQASCTDWYGNARPIFIGNLVFALMGYEIVEGRQDGARIVERRRVDFTPVSREGASPN